MPVPTALRLAAAISAALLWLPAMATAAPPPVATDPTLACPPQQLPMDDMIVVCVDASGESVSYRVFPEGARFVKPNRHFLVHVLHPDDRRVDISLGGQPGSWALGSRSTFKLSGDGFGGAGITGDIDERPPVRLISTQRTFAPRVPGQADLVVSFRDTDGAELASPLTVEFWVDTTYSGAFRVGVAGVFVGGLENRYDVVLAPGSAQQEISGGTRSLVDVDLVLGYSPYLDTGGRGQNGCENAPFCFNPYFGVGIVGANGAGSLDWLKSIHLGVEWELTDTFAIGLTANLRRVSRLAPGFDVGEPIDGSLPVRSAYVIGLGVVLNISPEFLKIGAEGARAVLR